MDWIDLAQNRDRWWATSDLALCVIMYCYFNRRQVTMHCSIMIFRYSTSFTSNGR